MNALLCGIIGFCFPTAFGMAARGENNRAVIVGAVIGFALILYIQLRTGGLS